MAVKTCTVCNKEKTLDEFYNLKATPDGKSYRCKICDKETTMDSRKKRYLRSRVQQRHAQRKCKYGITEEDFNALLESQEGKCPCCGKVLSEEFGRHHLPNKLVVDHCHKDSYVRGLLCTMCNKGIGLLGDNSEAVFKAYLYLKAAEDNYNADIH